MIMNNNLHQLDIKTPAIDTVLNNFKNRRLCHDDSNDITNNSLTNISKPQTVSLNESLTNINKSELLTNINTSKSLTFNELSISKQARYILFNDNTNNKLLKSMIKRYDRMFLKFNKQKDYEDVKDIARTYMNLANNNDINTIMTMMTNDTVCYGNEGIENVEKGMIAFHNSLIKPFWKINDLNIVTSDQLFHIDNFKNSHICNRKDLIHIEVNFTRYWVVNDMVEIANAIEIISVNNDKKIASILYSQLPIKAPSSADNKYPDEYTGIIELSNHKTNIVSDNESNGSGSNNNNEWYEYFNEQGNSYYHNICTNESAWEDPTTFLQNVHVYKQYQDEQENWYFHCIETGVSLWVE